MLLNKPDLARAEAWSKTDSDELGVSDRLERFLDESRDAVDRAEMSEQLEAERREARAKRAGSDYSLWSDSSWRLFWCWP